MDIISTFQESLKIQSESIKDNIDLIDESVVEPIKILSESNLILTTGVGKSGFIAKKFAATLSSYGVRAIYLEPVEALHGDLGIAEKNSSIVLISKSGTTSELLNLFPYLKARNINTVSITANKESFLAKNCDYHFYTKVEKESCPLNLAPTTSTTLALAICDSISASLVKIKDIKVEDFARNHPSGQLGRNNTLKVSDVMKSGELIPLVESGSMVKDAIIEISNKGLGCVCVLKSNTLYGILTDGDIRRSLQQNQDINETLIDDVMTKNPITIKQDATLGTALGVMENRKSKIGVLPVVDDSESLVGVIQIHDIFGENRF